MMTPESNNGGSLERMVSWLVESTLDTKPLL
jgi:hypothetical protein